MLGMAVSSRLMLEVVRRGWERLKYVRKRLERQGEVGIGWEKLEEAGRSWKRQCEVK